MMHCGKVGMWYKLVCALNLKIVQRLPKAPREDGKVIFLVSSPVICECVRIHSRGLCPARLARSRTSDETCLPCSMHGVAADGAVPLGSGAGHHAGGHQVGQHRCHSGTPSMPAGLLARRVSVHLNPRQESEARRLLRHGLACGGSGCWDLETELLALEYSHVRGAEVVFVQSIG